jgi:hypothetical protein
VAVNAGRYAHFGAVYDGEAGPVTLDFYPLAEHFAQAREQFQQVPSMLKCFEHWFGPYPWYRDGYKLVEVPHLGISGRYVFASAGNDSEAGEAGPGDVPASLIPRPYLMEARGIEPRSENDSDTATTCVGDAVEVSPPQRLAGRGSDEPLPALA